MTATSTSTFVIVGAGLAGAKAAETLRAEGFGGRLLLLGEEAERPYERPPLSKAYLRGETDRDSLYVHQNGFYAAHDIELRPSTPVRSITPSARRLELASGERIGYRRLLLATGAAPRRLRLPGAALAGVHYLRSRSDADTLAAAVARAEHVVVVGTGWIGSEAAASIRQLGRDVTLIGPDTAPLTRVLGPEIAAVYRDLHADHGVRLALGTRLAGIRGHGHVEAVVTDDGRTIDCDLVLIGAGAVPRTELAEAAALPVRNGVLVNEELEAVGAAGVYAAGDVAAAWHPHYQSYLHVEHWANALNQGPAAAKSMLGSADALRAAALLLLRPVRPQHGVLRASRPPGTRWWSGATRPLARSSPSGSRTAGRRRHERQRLGRHRAYPGPHPQRAAGRPGEPRRSRSPPGPGDRRGGGTTLRPAGDKEHPMTKLHQLYDRARPEPVARQPHPRLPARRHARPAGRRRDPRGDRQPDDLRQGHRGLRRLRRAVRGAHRRGRVRCRTPTGSWSCDDVIDALGVLRPTFDASGGTDGFVSIEVAPELARDTDATIAAARDLHERIAEPNLFVKIPATAEGVPAIAGDDRRGSQHQRHPDLLAVPLRAGDRGLPARAGNLRRARRRSRRGAQRRVVLRQPRRHRGRPAPRARSAPTTRWRCAAGPRSPRPSSPTSCSGTASPARGGSDWPPAAPTCNGRCGRRRRPRTPPTPTPSTSTASSAPTRSTRCPRPPSPRSRTTAPSPAPSTPTSTDADDGDAPARRASASTWTTSAAPSRTRASPASTQSFAARACAALDAQGAPARRRADDGLGRLGAVRAGRHRGPHRGHDRRPAGRAAPGSTCRCCSAPSSPRTPTGPGSPGSSSTSPIGQGFALGYAAGFALLDRATWWLGGLFGLLHVAVALTVLVPLLAGRASAHGVRPGRAGVDRRARTARPARPQLRRRRLPSSPSPPTSSTASPSACCSAR